MSLQEVWEWGYEFEQKSCDSISDRFVFCICILHFIIHTQHSGPKAKLHVFTILKTAKGTSNSFTNI